MPINISIFGDKELQDKLNALPEIVQKKLIKSSLKFGAEIVKARAEELAPEDEGRLKLNLHIEPFSSRKRGVGYRVSTGTREELGIDQKATGYYPTAQEFGSSRNSAHPYIRPATEASRAEVLELVEADLRSALE
jgi:HK97 gp10 family phage protein